MIAWLWSLFIASLAWFVKRETAPDPAPPEPPPVEVPDTRDDSKANVVVDHAKAVDDVRVEVAKTEPLLSDLDALVAHAKNVGKTTAFVLVAVLLSGRARAEGFPSPTPIESFPEGDDVMVPIRKGISAPIEGVILDPATLLRWTNWRTQAAKFRLADMDSARRWCSVETAYLAKERDAEHSARVSDIADLKGQLAKAQTPRAWWDYPAVGFLSGIIVAGAFLALGESLKR